MVRPDTKDFFWVKTADSKQDDLTFFSIDSVKQPCDELFRVSQVKDRQIYHLMQNVAMKRIKSREFITKNKNFTSGIVLQLQIMVVQPNKNENLKLALKNSNSLPSLLIKISEVNIKKTLEDLKKFSFKHSVVQV